MGRYWRQVWLGVFEDERCVWAFLAPVLNVTDVFRKDDRFIAKELSKAELQTMETFGPAYFEYMASAISGNVSSFSLEVSSVLNQLFIAPHLTCQGVWLL